MAVYFPKQIKLDNKIFTLIEESAVYSGLNPKKFYRDETGALFMAKVEKERGFEIFSSLFRRIVLPDDLINNKIKQASYLQTKGVDEKEQKKLQKHLDELRDAAVAMAVIASHIAKKLFPFLRVPENYLARLNDGMPLVLSRILPKEEKFSEFLKDTKPIKEKNPKTPAAWKTLLSRADLALTEEQACILGKLYYVALLMGHWDIINNIDLSNSGAVTVKGKLMPCIVDWGNCPQGFGGISQASTAFQNPEFKGLKLCTGTDPVTGFIGCVPFDKIVYPRLPRRVVADLFDITGQDSISKTMLAGFKQAHLETSVHFSQDAVNEAINEVLKPPEASQFRPLLDQELYGKNAHQPGVFGRILAGRLQSLAEIIMEIDQGNMIDQIADAQFTKIESSQRTPRSRL